MIAYAKKNAFAIAALILSFVSIYLASGCAHLERDEDPTYDAGTPPDKDPPGKPTDAGVVVYPDAELPPDAPPPPPTCEPECQCDDDCDPDGSERCLWNRCYERCACDQDCDHGYDCRWGICKRDH